MVTFARRLKWAKEAGNLTDADLARWFDRPGATVRCWIHDGINPGGGPGDRKRVFDLLSLLERLISRNKEFPVPRMSPRDKLGYLKKLRAGRG